MEFTAKTISEIIKGEIVGNPDAAINDFSKIDEGRAGTLSFLANSKYENFIYNTDSSIVIVNKDFKPEKKLNCTIIKVENPYFAFASLLELKDNARPKKTGIEDEVHIADTAKLGSNLFIGKFSYISQNAIIEDNVRIFPQVYIGENVIIKENTILYPGVKVYHDCIIGKNCIIHSGTVVGSDGFGFAPESKCEFKKIPQLGNVVIEDNVEFGSNCSIDRATMGSTIIRKGVKVDNLVQIAHNVEVGENTILVSQVGIAGSTKIGKNCMFGGQVGISGHIKIASNVIIGAQAGVGSNVNKEGEILLGSPAFNISDCRKSMAVYKKLPDMYKDISRLEKELEELKKNLNYPK